MTHILVSPAEPDILKGLGTVSSLPERYGVDFLWQSEQGEWCGLQRKEISDLVASVQGDRLSKELIQMKDLSTKMFIIEGRPVWGPNGNMMDKFTKWGRQAHHSLIQSLCTSGVAVHQTSDIAETSFVIQGLVKWTDKPEHTSLLSRPKEVRSTWGVSDERDWSIYLLQSLPGVSYTLARRIFDFFGRVPLQWTVSCKDLEQVKGIGRGKAASIYAALPASAATSQPTDSSLTP